MKKILLLTILTVGVLSLSTIAQVNLTQGLMAFYPFTGNPSDSSGNNNNGTVYGATLTTGLLGMPNSAYHFNGTSDYIQVPSSTSLYPPYDSITMCAVVKVEGFYTGTCQGNVIFWKGNYATSGLYGLTFSDQPYDGNNCSNLDTLHETFYGNINTNNTGLPYPFYITHNTWYCLICTFDGAVTKLYIDGTLRMTANSTTPIGSNALPLEIGRQNDVTFPYWFNGVIDEIRIYNRVINSSEINAYCSLVNSVLEQNQLSSFNLYPNPTTTEVTLNFGNATRCNIQLHNILGEMLEQFHTNSSTLSFNLADRPKGIYFITAIDEEGNKAVRKIVKM